MGMRIRLITSLIVAIIYCFIEFPIPTIVISVVGILCYVAYTYYSRKNVVVQGLINRRKSALYSARIFLGRYDDIWNNLRLSNSYCYLSLVDEMTIIGTEKNADGGSYRSFKVLQSNVHDWVEVWNLFCINFSHNKTYDGLVEDCRRFKLVIEEKVIEMPVKNFIQKKEENILPQNLVDINNASESDLTALPGISVIMAKKAIKRREEIGGFKSVDDFFLYLNIKPHMQEQLIKLICIKEMQGRKSLEQYNERNIDL